MDNNTVNTPYSINNKDDFKAETHSLLNTIRDQISTISAQINNDLASSSKLESQQKMSVLKIHEYKMKEALDWFHLYTDKTWDSVKATMQEAFKEAYEYVHS